MHRFDKLLLLLILIGSAAAVGLAFGRGEIEGRNRAVEIVIDGDDARRVAAAAGVPVEHLLAALREAGATALGVREQTVGDLVAEGRLEVRAVPGGTAVLAGEAGPPWLLRRLWHRLSPGLASVRRDDGGIKAALDTDVLMEVPVMLRAGDLEAARRVGVRPVARPRNFPFATEHSVAAAIAEAKAVGARLVIFDGEEVLGHDGLVGATAEALRENDLLYGYVEMAGQKGDGSLAPLLASRLVRVHSISDSEMLTMTPTVGTRRYARAVRERNIRACYVRLLARPRPHPVATNARYVGGIVQALRAQGFVTGPPAPYVAPEGWPPRWLRGIVLLSVPAAFVLLLRRLAPLGTPASVLLLAGALIAGAALGFLRGATVTPMAGLLAACIFPALGVVTVLQGSRGAIFRLPAGRLLGGTLRGLAVGSFFSLAGGLIVAGLYSRVAYLVGVDQFRGVKVATLAPLAVVLLVTVTDLRGTTEPLRQWWARLRLQGGRTLGRPVSLAEATVILAALAALIIALMRTGNQPLVAPSSAEIGLRDQVESLLVIRPRTKEFLLGHPALMLAVALSLRGRRSWLPLVAVFAGVGQASVLNTFCHFHTPLAVTLLRVANGLWIGALIGIALVLVWRLVLDRKPRELRS